MSRSENNVLCIQKYNLRRFDGMVFRSKLLSLVLAGAVVLGCAISADATNGYDMIALGAKSLGEAGATVAHPLDSSTILQNPAGIGMLNSTVNVAGAVFLPTRNLNGENSSSNVYMIPAAGFVVNPAGNEGTATAFSYGIGMFGVSGMGVDWSNQNLTGTGWLKKAYSNLQVMEFGAGGAYRVNSHLSVGITPVFVYQSLQMEYDWNVQYPSGYTPPPGSPTAGVHRDVLDTATAYGFGFNAGALYEINDYVQIGAAYTSPRWMGKLLWNVTPDSGTMMINPGASTVSMRLDMPQQVAAGIHVQPLEYLGIEADAKWINYHAVMNQVDTQGLLTGAPNNTWNFNWKDQWVFAISPEYRITKSLTVAAGYNYGQDPIDSSSLNNNIIAPAIVQSHITAGITYGINDHLDVSGAYAYAFSETLSCTNSGQYYAMFGPKTTIDMHQNTAAIELSYKF